jgi:predicted nucleic acid-binding Zn ribbon protein
MPGIAAPGREWAEPVMFDAAVRRMLIDRGWEVRATTAAVLARWDVLVGPNISSHCHPVSLRGGDLELAAESTTWATQVRLLSRQLLGILRKEFGPDVVRRIVVRGPTTPSWRHGSRYAPGGRGPRDTYG